MIYQFVKNKKGQLVGCVVAVGRNQVGWSKCRTTYGFNTVSGLKIPVGPDAFNKTTALNIATGRAKVNPVTTLDSVPMSIRLYVTDMLSRSIRYFKK